MHASVTFVFGLISTTSQLFKIRVHQLTCIYCKEMIFPAALGSSDLVKSAHFVIVCSVIYFELLVPSLTVYMWVILSTTRQHNVLWVFTAVPTLLNLAHPAVPFLFVWPSSVQSAPARVTSCPTMSWPTYGQVWLRLLQPNSLVQKQSRALLYCFNPPLSFWLVCNSCHLMVWCLKAFT